MRQVAAMREQHGDLLLRGRFIDVDGVIVEGAQVVGKAFQSDDRIGVILWNPTDQPQSAKVAVAGRAFSAAYAPGASDAVDRTTPIAPESIRLLVWNSLAPSYSGRSPPSRPPWRLYFRLPFTRCIVESSRHTPCAVRRSAGSAASTICPRTVRRARRRADGTRRVPATTAAVNGHHFRLATR